MSDEQEEILTVHIPRSVLVEMVAVAAPHCAGGSDYFNRVTFLEHGGKLLAAATDRYSAGIYSSDVSAPKGLNFSLRPADCRLVLKNFQAGKQSSLMIEVIVNMTTRVITLTSSEGFITGVERVVMDFRDEGVRDFTSVLNLVSIAITEPLIIPGQAMLSPNLIRRVPTSVSQVEMRWTKRTVAFFANDWVVIAAPMRGESLLSGWAKGVLGRNG